MMLDDVELILKEKGRCAEGKQGINIDAVRAEIRKLEEKKILYYEMYWEVFELDGKKAIVMGGAYSIDKMMRLMYGYGWWPDEQPSEEILVGWN